MNTLYLVEVIRYGDPKLGCQAYGVFDCFNKIAPEMKAYNSFRGGKYPAYYVQELDLNPKDISRYPKVRYEVE